MTANSQSMGSIIDMRDDQHKNMKADLLGSSPTSTTVPNDESPLLNPPEDRMSRTASFELTPAELKQENVNIFQRQEAILYTIVNQNQLNATPTSQTHKNPIYNQHVDYDDAWEALGGTFDSHGPRFPLARPSLEQQASRVDYSAVKAEHSFVSQTSGIKDGGTRLLKDLVSGGTRGRRRAKSETCFNQRLLDQNDVIQTIVVNTGLNWVCTENPSNHGLNAPCMQPPGKGALAKIKPATISLVKDKLGQNCDGPIVKDVQARNILRRKEIIRQKIEDKVGNLHDEKLIYFMERNTGRVVSPWHDIALVSDATDMSDGLLLNMIVEIPRFHSAKMEISTTRTHNPILQDRCKKLNQERNYSGPIPWNYGAFPQTWEDPSHAGDREVNNALGDCDPLDVVDVGREPTRGEVEVGEVIPIRVLGCLPMLDGGDELDWKVIGISPRDANFDRIHDLYSLEQVYPHTLNGVREWFRWYKFSADNSVLNDFGYQGLTICRCEAEKVIKNTHQQWRRLLKKTHQLSRSVQRAEENKSDRSSVSNKEIDLAAYTDLLGDDFPTDIWVPGKLRGDSRAFRDRNAVWEGYLAINAGNGYTRNFD